MYCWCLNICCQSQAGLLLFCVQSDSHSIVHYVSPAGTATPTPTDSDTGKQI